MKVPFTNLDRLYVGGEWVLPRVHEPVINPATEEVIGLAPKGGVVEAAAAIAAARQAFDHGPWPAMAVDERVAVLRRMLAGLAERAEPIKALLCAEVGSTFLLNNTVQFPAALQAFGYALNLAATLGSQSTPVEINPDLFDPTGPARAGAGAILREPYGVVAAITPFNYPLLMAVMKIAPALVAGNTVVLKPSPFTPFSTLLLGELAQEAGLPAGVLNVITGGPDVGSLLTSDPAVDMISFTGSDTVGAAIAAQAAPTLKRLHLELGGKSALIVRADVDLQAAAMAAVVNFTLHAGQGCALLTRCLVHNSIRPGLVATMQAVLSQWKVGDPADPTVMMGPLIREAARRKTEQFVQLGLDGGARLVHGGKRPGSLEKGFFFEPTLFDDVDNRSALAQQEVFGPVGAVIGFDSDDEAVALANDSRFGLAGGILSRDRAAAYQIATRMRTGQVWINGGTGTLSMQAPFGGYRRSGMGRELGPRWLDEYTQEKSILFPIG